MSVGLVGLALAAILVVGRQRRAGWRDRMLRWDTGISGDGLQYFTLAVRLANNHSFSLDGKEPTWARLPGYPLLLRAFTKLPTSAELRSDDLMARRRTGRAWIEAQVRLNLATDLACALAVALLAAALGARRYSLLAAAAWALQPWTTVVAFPPLCDILATLVVALCLAAAVRAMRRRSDGWFAAAGLLAGLEQMVRPEGFLLLGPLGAGALLVGGSGRRRLALMAATIAGFMVTVSPWGVRNLVRFGDPHLLGGGLGVDQKGRPFDRRALFAWERTWAASEEATLFAWKIPGWLVSREDLPPGAIDSPLESDEVTGTLMLYDAHDARLDDDLDARFARIASDHRARHRFDFWVRLPLRRIKLGLLAPRDGFGLGRLPTPPQHRVAWLAADHAVMAAGVLGWLALLVGRRRRAERRALALALGLHVLLRMLLLAWIPTVEPRYGFEALPVFVALASLVPSLRGWRSEPPAEKTPAAFPDPARWPQ